ncbi:MAG: hypothetical protein WBK77_02115 [Alphaproteobacteria bacterium]
MSDTPDMPDTNKATFFSKSEYVMLLIAMTSLPSLYYFGGYSKDKDALPQDASVYIAQYNKAVNAMVENSKRVCPLPEGSNPEAYGDILRDALNIASPEDEMLLNFTLQNEIVKTSTNQDQQKISPNTHHYMTAITEGLKPNQKNGIKPVSTQPPLIKTGENTAICISETLQESSETVNNFNDQNLRADNSEKITKFLQKEFGYTEPKGEGYRKLEVVPVSDPEGKVSTIVYVNAQHALSTNACVKITLRSAFYYGAILDTDTPLAITNSGPRCNVKDNIAPSSYRFSAPPNGVKEIDTGTLHIKFRTNGDIANHIAPEDKTQKKEIEALPEVTTPTLTVL